VNRDEMSPSRFEEEFLIGRPPPATISAGPWTYKRHTSRNPHSGDNETEFVVLDAEHRDVATCDREIDADAIIRWRNSLLLGPSSTGYSEGNDAAIDWERYPKLRGIFEERPRESEHWVELANLARDLTRTRR